MTNTVRVAIDPDEREGTTFILDNGVVITLPRSFLDREVKVAATDPDRVDGAFVDVPVEWLVGRRVGY